MAELFSSGPPDPVRAEAIQREYHLDLDLSRIARLVEAHGLSVGRT
jgi:hypothetical protein